MAEQAACFRALSGACELSGSFPQQLRAKPHVSLAYWVREKEITKLVSYKPGGKDILCTPSARGRWEKQLMRITVGAQITTQLEGHCIFYSLCLFLGSTSSFMNTQGVDIS